MLVVEVCVEWCCVGCTVVEVNGKKLDGDCKGAIVVDVRVEWCCVGCTVVEENGKKLDGACKGVIVVEVCVGWCRIGYTVVEVNGRGCMKCWWFWRRQRKLLSFSKFLKNA